MDTIRDLTWVKHLHTGRVIERCTLSGFRFIALSLPSQSHAAPMHYLYRLLFFPETGHKPILSLNLEMSILGSACLTEQLGARHTRFETVDQGMSYSEFRRWAISRAQTVLGPVAAPLLSQAVTATP